MINEQLSAEQRAELLDKIPVKKFCTPEEIAHTVDYLISPLAGFVTVRCFSLRLLICYMFISIIKQCVGSHCPHTIDNATRCCCTG